MGFRTACLCAIIMPLALGLWPGLIPAAQDQMFQYDYSFRPGSEPDGFRGLKWQTDVAKLDPLTTMDVLEVYGPYTYYAKKNEDLRLVTVDVHHIVYEFWNGKFAGVIIKVKGRRQFDILKEYVFTRFGPGQRTKVLEQMDVQEFYYNGLKTRMYLQYSDIDRVGELSLYSIALLSKQQKLDNFYLKREAKERVDAWLKTKGK